MEKQTQLAFALSCVTSIVVTGCQTARNVAVTGFHVIDAPAAYVRRHIDGEPDTTTTTTTTTVVADSDVVSPGRPINPPRKPTGVGSENRTHSTGRSPGGIRTETAKIKSSTHPARATNQQGAEIPYAKPVPGKPGYVVSPFDPNGGYVDVTGYPPGSKAKDPYSKKIFLVP